MEEWIRKNYPDAVILDVGGNLNLPNIMDAIEPWEVKCIAIKDRFRNVFHKNVSEFEYGEYDLIIFEFMTDSKTIDYAKTKAKDVILPAPHPGFVKIPNVPFYHMKEKKSGKRNQNV